MTANLKDRPGTHRVQRPDGDEGTMGTRPTPERFNHGENYRGPLDSSSVRDGTDQSAGVPMRLRELATAAVVQLPQPAMLLDRGRWSSALQGRKHVDRLPAKLDRESVRNFCNSQVRDRDGVIAVFLASQIWGYGDRGYGPHRVKAALEHPDLVPALQCAADELDDGNPVDAFEALCVVFELPNLAMSFGTKYLFFADRHRQALILDRLVGAWLVEHADIRLRLTRHPDSYRLWLESAAHWADELGATSEEVELMIFSDALPDGSQWAAAESPGL